MFKQKKVKVHFIGIGGVGMSGIAEVLLALGHKVSGSDVKSGSVVERLRNLGAEIFIGHSAGNLGDSKVVVYSSIISEENPEMVEAKKRNLPTIQRAEMLAELMRFKYGLAVAGSHGKTTTTSFLATILSECGLDSTHVIGGLVENLGGNAKWGGGDLLVAEADESDGSFLLLSPVMSVITNIDDDHLDYYGNFENLKNAFIKFANKVPFYGVCSINLMDPGVREIRDQIKRPVVTFGLMDTPFLNEEIADYGAANIISDTFSSTFDLIYKGEKKINMKILLPGKHNVMNALGAISLAHQCDLSFEQIGASISKFVGVGRRLEKLFYDPFSNLEIIDDYGHHPTEIASTLQAVREMTGTRKFYVFFEPHRYSRTQNCWQQFLHCFNSADKVFIFPIYPAFEKEIEGIHSKRLVADINHLHPSLVEYIDSINDLELKIRNIWSENKDALILTLGAGAIGKRIREVVANMKRDK